MAQTLARLAAFFITLLLLALAAGLALAAAPKPLKVMALVIGQSKYQHLAPLNNPGNDARAVAKLFADLGFAVTATSDRDARKLRRDLRDFAADVESEAADVAVIYQKWCAGCHGLQTRWLAGRA